jgi:hypothetical protein
MTTKTIKQFFSVLACSTLLIAGSAEGMGQQDPVRPPQNSSQPSSASQSSPSSPAPTVELQTPDQLDALVAPIALYPNALVAQVLAASAYPDQVAFADDWLAQNKSLTGSAVAQAVDQQSWDPSVKALTQFPSVMDDLAHNLSWTSSLGQAFTNQQAEVMAAVQTMRTKAQAAGTLQSSSQITVVQQSPSTIVIKPANPQVVYVPQYNPTIVYGTPYVVPLYTPPVAVVAPVVSFGAGIAIGGGGFVGGGFVGGGFSWGFSSWNCNWGGGGGGNIIYNHNTYINKTVINRTTNNSYNGYHPWGPNNLNGYHPGTDTHYGPNGGYHPNGYYGPNGGFHHDVPGTNPNDQPNGGNNGNHGLIGGNGGVQRGAADYADHGQTGYGALNGGYRSNQPNGVNYGNHGLLGSDSGMQRSAAGYGGQRMQANDNRDNFGSGRDRDNSSGRMNQPRSYISGNGDRDRAAANRGRASMRPARQPRPQHMSAPHNTGGGHRR